MLGNCSGCASMTAINGGIQNFSPGGEKLQRGAATTGKPGEGAQGQALPKSKGFHPHPTTPPCPFLQEWLFPLPAYLTGSHSSAVLRMSAVYLGSGMTSQSWWQSLAYPSAHVTSLTFIACSTALFQFPIYAFYFSLVWGSYQEIINTHYENLKFVKFI